MCSNPCESEVTCFRPESNLGPYGLLTVLSAALSTTELWWRMNHRKSFRTRYQNLDLVDRDSESRRSISCGILLFPPTARWSSPCRIFHPVHRFWMAPPLWMVSHRYGPRSSCTFALGEEPRLYHNTPGQALTFHAAQTSSARIQDVDEIQRIHISRFLTSGIEPEPRGSWSRSYPLDQRDIKRLISRWSSGYLLDYEPRGSGSIPEVTNLEICILRIPSISWSCGPWLRVS